MSQKLQVRQMYEIEISALQLVFGNGETADYPEALTNGRVNYVIFENLVRDLSGLKKTTGIDHLDESGARYEQKAYKDPDLHPSDADAFRFSPSNTFGANNNGPKVKRLLSENRYDDALSFLRTVKNGYDSIDFFVFTNSGGYSPEIPFRFFIIEKEIVLDNLDQNDPRYVSKQSLFNILKPEVVRLTWDE